MLDYFQSLLDLIAQHPHLAIGLAFAVSMAEAILVIGLFVPSTVVLAGLGGLAGIGKLDFWLLFAATTLGAIAGDAIGYWLGRIYHERLGMIWPLSRYPGMLDAGRRYFARHGGKSVMIGRFIPGIKSVVPAIAGMSGMGNIRFTFFNSTSAVAWAAAHLLPGYSAGAFLVVTGMVSKRLAILLAVAFAALVIAIWLARETLRLGARSLPRLQNRLASLAAARSGRVAASVLRLVSPDHADFRLLTMLAALFGAAIIGFIAILEDVVSGESGLGVDASISQFFQGLRTTVGDQVMISATMLGDAPVTIAVAVAAAIALTLARRIRLAAALIATLAFASAFASGLKLAIRTPRPAEMFSGAEAYSFPSGHAATAATLYGALGLIALLGAPGRAGRIAAALLSGLIGLIAVSRLYLAAHWPSDVAAGLLFGAAAVAGLAAVFRRYPVSSLTAGGTLGAAALALGIAGTWHIRHSFAEMEAVYATPSKPVILLRTSLRAGGWQDLPVARVDLAGEQEELLLLQWQGSSEDLAAALGALGWHSPPAWSLTSLNAFAAPGAVADDLPVLPQLHNGRRQILTAVLPTGSGEPARYVLRAWRLEAQDPAGPVELLAASVIREAIASPFGLLSLPLPDDEAACNGSELLARLPGAVQIGPEMQGTDGACGGQMVLVAK